jgi:hypothetical protein
MNAVEEFEANGLNVKIYSDEDPINPRVDYDNDDVMVAFHKRYSLGDKHNYSFNDFNSWDELKAQICKDNDVLEILPLYLLDHSGITISTTDFNDKWDSGMVGFIFITKDEARKSHMVKKISKKVRETCHKNLLSSVETYNQYIRNDVYGYVIEDKDENEIDSCWGFFGLAYCIEEAKDAAKNATEILKTA